ncbi:sigma-70 family RNA polymerase sigma factor [Streptomyces sp. ISL-98]|uniref:RNA polymerase sigma factor n=1 Tax=Streptomyces sp. ISL-98 TaxID=2819192 RepID=UPI001BE6622A|nr:sigma-70 family RNA polymerase sigma factor [Streptomyces sp. ISL-98]MBT2510176.1 sigma-70 family RNA polymerase sigma factor [Streptomyces sp. ISL-98]
MNAAALDAVYRAYRDEMTAVAARLLRNRIIPEAMIGREDVVQLAFEGALRAPGKLREPRAYVYRTLRREVIHQAERLHQAREREAEHLVDEHMATRHGRDVASLVAEHMMVFDALRELPLQQRIALVATKMYGFTQREMAQIAEIHPGTVAVSVARAATTLRHVLSSWMPPVGSIAAAGASFPSDPVFVWWVVARIGASESQGDLRVEFIALYLELETELEAKSVSSRRDGGRTSTLDGLCDLQGGLGGREVRGVDDLGLAV